jgi:uncharacterized protein YkwD
VRKLYCLSIAVLLTVLGECVHAQPPERADVEKATELIVERTNAFRKENKLPSVNPEKRLTAAAEYFAQFMAETGNYSHTADDREPSERAAAHDYDFCIVLENIAYMFSSEGYATDELGEGFTQGWIDSPGHRANMVDPDIVHTGVSIVRDPQGKYYAVQMFGRPKSMANAFTIRNEAGEEISYRVSGESFSLPARYAQSHTVCRPPQLQFNWKDAKPLTPPNNATLTIRKTRRGDYVVEQK